MQVTYISTSSIITNQISAYKVTWVITGEYTIYSCTVRQLVSLLALVVSLFWIHFYLKGEKIGRSL